MKPTVRFAPSPTGNLHIGNARPALINWLFALRHGGQYVLRFDDTDRERSTREFADGIERDLAWLGITPHRMVRQSDRASLHRAAQDRLAQAGLLYPCFETADELERRRKRQAMRGLPPVYDRAALKLSADERAALEADGRRPHWRFLLPNHGGDPFAPTRTEVRWDDAVRGEQVVDLASVSDPVLVREDGSWLYTLPSVVDDIDLKITHVIRGDDHVTNTGVQIALFRALGAEPPVFGHVNLLTTASGEGLSKRLGSLSLRSLAEAGYEPMAIASLAVLTGTSAAVEPCASMEELAGRLDLQSIGRSSARFDPSELDSLNGRLVHRLSWSDVRSRFGEEAFEGRGEALWKAVGSNLSRVRELAEWWDVVASAVPVIDPADEAFLREAAHLLPPAPWDGSTWSNWIGRIKDATGRKGRQLFMPLRLALTGRDHGPEMAALLPLIGPERTRARLP